MPDSATAAMHTKYSAMNTGDAIFANGTIAR